MKFCSKKLQTFMFHAVLSVNRIMCPVFNAGTQPWQLRKKDTVTASAAFIL